MTIDGAAQRRVLVLLPSCIMCLRYASPMFSLCISMLILCSVLTGLFCCCLEM